MGITLFEMIFVDIPFIELPIIKYLMLIGNRSKFEELLQKYKGRIESAVLKTLIDKCLTYEAEERPTSLELYQSLEVSNNLSSMRTLDQNAMPESPKEPDYEVNRTCLVL